MPEVSMPRLVISGLSGGSGKTLVSLGLCRALHLDGYRIKSYKKGPDYIDAAWLGLAAGCTTTNLDPFFLSEDRLRALFQEAFAGAEIAVIEGNRGLYDGRDIDGTCSTAALARTLDAPVLVTLNITKMTRTAAAIIAGLLHFEPLRLGGVILNQIGSARHSSIARQSIENHTGIPVLGALPRLQKNPIPERHMGLVSVHDESSDTPIADGLNVLADFLRNNADIDAIRNLALTAPELPSAPPFWTESISSKSITHKETAASSASHRASHSVKIGFVRDAALWFYYEENLHALRRAGADLIELSLLKPDRWPEMDGLYLGGGFPEMLAERLAASPHLARIKDFSECGMPIYAECGGFMILCEAIRCHGEDHPMTGLFPARAEFCQRPQGLGYVEATVTAENPFHPLGTVFRGHEFHYSRCVPLGPMTSTLQLKAGAGMACGSAHHHALPKGADGLLIRNTFAAYTHLYAPAAPHWAERFLCACTNQVSFLHFIPPNT